MVGGEQAVEARLGQRRGCIAHLHVAHLDHDTGRGAMSSSSEDLGVDDGLAAHPAACQASTASLPAMTVAATTGPKRSPLPLVKPGVRLNQSKCSTSS